VGTRDENNGFYVWWLDLLTPSFTNTLSKGYTALPLVYSFPESLGHATRFLATITSNLYELFLPFRLQSVLIWTQLNSTQLWSNPKSESKSHCDWRSVSQLVLMSSSQSFSGSSPNFTVSYLRLPFSSPPTTCKVTVEVFDPASTQDWSNPRSQSHTATDGRSVGQSWCLRGNLFIEPLPSSRNPCYNMVASTHSSETQ
jgi:hypothetical protein